MKFQIKLESPYMLKDFQVSQIIIDLFLKEKFQFQTLRKKLSKKVQTPQNQSKELKNKFRKKHSEK